MGRPPDLRAIPQAMGNAQEWDRNLTDKLAPSRNPFRLAGLRPQHLAPTMAPMSHTARHIFVSGRVQGVGFRWFVRERAVALRIKGWVRNLRDGRVEAWLEGPPEVLASMLEQVRGVPPPARIDGIEVEEGEMLGLEKFELQRGSHP